MLLTLKPVVQVSSPLAKDMAFKLSMLSPVLCFACHRFNIHQIHRPLTSFVNPRAEPHSPSNPPGNASTGKPFEVGKENSHSVLDRKDEHSHANTIEAAKKNEQKEMDEQEKKDYAAAHPTEAARSHGNEPSRGAKKDEEIVEDEEEELRKKEEAKAQSKEAHKHKHH